MIILSKIHLFFRELKFKYIKSSGYVVIIPYDKFDEFVYRPYFMGMYDSPQFAYHEHILQVLSQYTGKYDVKIDDDIKFAPNYILIFRFLHAIDAVDFKLKFV